MIDAKLVKCDPADPRRCQATTGTGQCPFLAAEGHTNCIKHGAFAQESLKETKNFHNYMLGVWQQRVNEFCASEQTTSLAGEIGIMRMSLEVILNQCQDQNQLLMFSSRIADMTSRIERLCSTFDKISSKSSNLLDKSAALVLAGKIVDIISANVNDTETVNKISNDIISLVAQLCGKELELEDE